MKLKYNKELFVKYSYITFSICAIIVFYFFIYNIVYISKLIANTLSIIITSFRPFIIGLIIAYFLFRPVRYIEKKLLKLTYFKKHIKGSRLLAILCVYFFLLLSIYFFMDAVIPKMIESIKSIIQNLPTLIQNTQTRIMKFSTNNQVISKFAENIESESTKNTINKLQTSNGIQELIFGELKVTGLALTNIVSITLQKLLLIGAYVFGIFISMFIAIYILLDKEGLSRQVSRISRIIIGKEKFSKVIRILKLVDEVFYKFFAGKLICSVIIGILYFIGLLILKVNHAILISVVIGVTNMIPVFGPIIGVIPGVVITLFYSPIKAIWLVILAIIVQQIDENILAPKIIGNIIGLNPFWILCSIIIGGQIFGIVGMFIAIPVFAVLRIFIVEWMNIKDTH